MTDESVNVYGFRVLTNGIDYSDFLNNPVGYWNHRNEDEYKESELLPLFRWENLRVENNKLIGDLVPDVDDEQSMKVFGKIERGFVNAASVTIEPVELSESPEDMLAGQTLPTFKKSRLIECSPCGIPGNSNALRLKNKSGKYISLNNQTKSEDVREFLNPLSNNQKTDKMSDKLIATLAGALGCDPTEAEVSTAIAQLKSDKKDAESKASKAEKELKDFREQTATPMIDEAIEAGVLEEDERDDMVQLCNTNYSAFSKLMTKLTGKKKPDNAEGADAPSLKNAIVNLNGGGGSAPNSGAAGADNSKECEFDILSKQNPAELSRIQEHEPDRFQKMYEEKRKRLSANAIKGAKV